MKAGHSEKGSRVGPTAIPQQRGEDSCSPGFSLSLWNSSLWPCSPWYATDGRVGVEQTLGDAALSLPCYQYISFCPRFPPLLTRAWGTAGHLQPWKDREEGDGPVSEAQAEPVAL